MSTMKKRFRPSVDSICSHERCTEPPSTVPCAHCSSIFCLRHLFEHQRLVDIEQKRLLSGIENYRTHLKMIQFNDNRQELFQQLDEWKEKMVDNVERMKSEIDIAYEQCDQEFDNIKTKILNNDDQDDRSLNKVSSYLQRNLHTLESSHLQLIMLPSTPMIRVLKPNFNSSFSYVQCATHPNLKQLLSGSKTVFTLDYDIEDDGYPFATSPEHLIIYKFSTSILQLFNHLGEHLFDIRYDYSYYGDLNQITWSPSLNEFLLATSKQLLRLDCSTEYLRRVDVGFGFYKDVCAGGDSILLVHHLGTSLGDVIEHYSNNQLIQRCWKSDLYPDDINETMRIVCIRMSGHLLAIHASFTDAILICDILGAMKCLFRIELKGHDVLSICPIYDTQQWLLFPTVKESESDQRGMFVINALGGNPQQRVYELKCNGRLPRNIYFFGSNHFIFENFKHNFECRKMSHVL